MLLVVVVVVDVEATTCKRDVQIATLGWWSSRGFLSTATFPLSAASET